MSGWTVPGYTELKTLGVGGFGAVVMARHDATGTPVAIKFLRPALLGDPEFAELFRDEAVLLGAVDSPYVVRLYEYVESPDGAAIVMELVDGVSLSEIVARHGKTTPESALLVLYGSLLGLAAAHARGVVHRDFKPANVLVNSHGASKLTDFGISARTGSTTVPAGSLSYAPPEQFDGGPATPASDVYAATATFYQCLTGHPPFLGNTQDELIAAHRSVPVPLDQVPEALRSIVAAGMAKDPGQRQADATALAAELRTVAAGAYGPDWEERGRSHLGAAAVLLAALWPTGGAPAVHGFTAEQVQLTRGQQAAANQHVHGQQVTHGAQHNAHQWHVLHSKHAAHLRHLRWLRAATAAAAGCAVVAAVVTVAATRAPGGPGTAARPAVAAYTAALTPPAAVSATLSSNFDRAGDPWVRYAPANLGVTGPVLLSGLISGAVTGEVARLYAQQFPFTSAPVPIQSVTLNPAGGSAYYDFHVLPALATRYQVRLLRSAAAATPLAVSPVKTVYVVDYERYYYAANSASVNMGICPDGQLGCTAAYATTIYAPAAALTAEMSKRMYLYRDVPSDGSSISFQLDTDATFSVPQRVGDDAYQVIVSIPNGGELGGVSFGICIGGTEAQDGVGLPGPSVCGSPTIPLTAAYPWQL
jgi:eukaryotic-like serine/threonine-protein kinase